MSRPGKEEPRGQLLRATPGAQFTRNRDEFRTTRTDRGYARADAAARDRAAWPGPEGRSPRQARDRAPAGAEGGAMSRSPRIENPSTNPDVLLAQRQVKASRLTNRQLAERLGAFPE